MSNATGATSWWGTLLQVSSSCTYHVTKVTYPRTQSRSRPRLVQRRLLSRGSSRASAGPGGDRYVLVPGHEVRYQPFRPTGGLEVLEAGEQLVEQYLDGHPGDAVSDAVVRSRPERQVLVRLAADVEGGRVRERPVVPVRGA